MAGLAVLSDVVLPQSVMAAGVRGKQMRRNARSQNQAGYVRANVVWFSTLRQYEVGFIPMEPQAWLDLEAVFEVTDGGAYGFLLEDPKDRACTVSDGIVQQDGDDWRLYKRFAVAAHSRDRRITRPRTGAAIYINGVAADATYSTTTGIVTWGVNVPEEGDSVTWAGLFYVPVHFAADEIDWELVRPGPFDQRLVEGPSVLLQEVRE